MLVSELKNAVMFQTNNDTEDVGDFMPALMGYLNEGYDALAVAYAGVHLSPEHPVFRPLASDTDEPALPRWMHHAISDFATWCVYRNGNSQKQQRGYAFRSAFDEVCQRAVSEGGQSGRATSFKNIPW